MRPLLLQFVVPGVGPIALSAWFTLVILGVCLGMWVAAQEARRGGDDPRAVLQVATLCVLAGLAGGRLGHLATTSRDLYLQDPMRLLRFWEGGMVLLGGLAVAIPVGLLAARRRGMSPLRTADAIAPALALGIALGRVGCFFAGCCYGRPIEYGTGVEWPFAAVFLGGQVPEALRGVALHPTQIYASLAALLLFVVLRRQRVRQTFDGQVAALFLVLYGSIRPLLELLRFDAARGFLLPEMLGEHVSTSQALSVPMLVAGVAASLWARRQAQGEGVAGLNAHGAREARRRAGVQRVVGASSR